MIVVGIEHLHPICRLEGSRLRHSTLAGDRDCDAEFFIASGPGGQRRNKVETGVRLIHRPSGIIVTATECRSQRANREVAFERMAARLQELQCVSKPRRLTRPTAASRVRRLEAKRQAGLLKKQRSAPRRCAASERFFYESFVSFCSLSVMPM